MADTQVFDNPEANSEVTGFWGPYWIDTQKAIMVFVNASSVLYYSRTTDGGANWTNTVIETGITENVNAWFDKETPGDTGQLLHVGWLHSTDNEAKYVDINISTGTVGTIRTVASGLTVDITPFNRITLTKTISGNLILAFRTRTTEIACYRSVDAGVNWTTRANPFEAAAEDDYLLLYPANTGDDNDACGIFLDLSASEMSIKMYDDSADSWTETLISTGMVRDLRFIAMDAAVRHSDKHILLAAHTGIDSATDDLKTWDLTVDSIASPTVTAKTNIFTDQVESGQAGLIINQQNDDVYVAYLKGGIWNAEVDVVYHKSTDDMSSWGTQQAYSESASDDFKACPSGRTVGNSGGRIQWGFYNDDTLDIWVNLTNDIEIVPAGTNMKINIGDAFKEVKAMQINIGDAWKDVIDVKQNIGGVWKDVFL